MKKRTYRVAILNTHPIQYFAPLYKRIAQEPEIDLTVYYCSHQGVDEYADSDFGKPIKWDLPLLEGYRYRFLPNLRRRDQVNGGTSLINPSIVKEIRKGHYDVLWLHGYTFISDWLALATARLSGTKIFYRSESSLSYDRRVNRPRSVRLIKPLLLRSLFKQIKCFLAIGTLNKEFYLHYGARPEQIYHVPYAVDNEYFASKVSECRAQRDDIRASMGINPNDIVFLFAAKMTPKKSPLELLQAYERLADLPNKAIIMAGDGELRTELEAYVDKHKLSGVHFVGFLNQSELPKCYAISDVFVRADGLYKGDWGLTVNEAMAAELAIIASDSIGVTTDLVKTDENGLVVRFGDLADLARAMRRMVLDPEACLRMGKRSAEIISGWGFDQCVKGVLNALYSIDQRGAKGV
jgi:glycosyltransferase involved in cell wall biosynthesis